MKREASRDLGTPTQSSVDSSIAPFQPITMIECVACGDMVFTPVVYPEADALFSDGTISRPASCAASAPCGEEWQ